MKENESTAFFLSFVKFFNRGRKRVQTMGEAVTERELFDDADIIDVLRSYDVHSSEIDETRRFSFQRA